MGKAAFLQQIIICQRTRELLLFKCEPSVFLQSDGHISKRRIFFRPVFLCSVLPTVLDTETIKQQILYGQKVLLPPSF